MYNIYIIQYNKFSHEHIQFSKMTSQFYKGSLDFPSSFTDKKFI